jgi:uncharacterized protein YegP (UPF0339 family)
MSKHIQLNVSTPCNENWDQMKPVDRGRFCGSCQKQVIDFTSMSDTQLVEFFRRPSTGSVCGRFMQDQLDRSIELPKKRLPWIKYFFQFAIPAFLFSLKASAQGEVKVLKGDTVLVPDSKVDLAGVVLNITDIDLPRDREIKGIVINEEGAAIPYASVFIKGTTIGVAADSTGRFKMNYLGTEDSVILVSSCVGYQTKETCINVNSDIGLRNVLLRNETLLSGEVIVIAYPATIGKVIYAGGVSVKQTSFVDTFITLINKVFLLPITPKVYPNPVKGNSAVTIDMRKQEDGTYSFQLYTMAGQLIVNNEKRVDKNNSLISLSIPPVTPGAYMLRIQNRGSGKKLTEKIIIE